MNLRFFLSTFKKAAIKNFIHSSGSRLLVSEYFKLIGILRHQIDRGDATSSPMLDLLYNESKLYNGESNYFLQGILHLAVARKTIRDTLPDLFRWIFMRASVKEHACWLTETNRGGYTLLLSALIDCRLYKGELTANVFRQLALFLIDQSLQLYDHFDTSDHPQITADLLASNRYGTNPLSVAQSNNDPILMARLGALRAKAALPVDSTRTSATSSPVTPTLHAEPQVASPHTVSIKQWSLAECLGATDTSTLWQPTQVVKSMQTTTATVSGVDKDALGSILRGWHYA